MWRALCSLTDAPAADPLTRMAIDPVLLGHAHLWLAQVTRRRQDEHRAGAAFVRGATDSEGDANGDADGYADGDADGYADGDGGRSALLAAAEIFRTCLGECHSLTATAQAALEGCAGTGSGSWG